MEPTATFITELDGVHVPDGAPDSGEVFIPANGFSVRYERALVTFTRWRDGVQEHFAALATRFQVLPDSEFWTGWSREAALG